MLLTEFIYYDEDQANLFDKNRYNPEDDDSILKSSDLRKSRLTLGMLNRLRKASDAREAEQKKELLLVRTMYATPVEESPV